MRKQTKLWTTRDGTKIRICDMSNIHLKNAMLMLQRTAELTFQTNLDAAYSFASGCRGDMASYCAEQAADEIGHEDWRSYVTDIYWAMQKDMERREATACTACLGYGLRAWGDASPIGHMEARDGCPTLACPECGANANPSTGR